MAGEKRERAELERQVSELTRRIAELEGRIGAIEGRAPATAAPQPGAGQPTQNPWPMGQQWGPPAGWWQPGQYQPGWPPQQPPQQPWSPPQQRPQRPPQQPPQPTPQPPLERTWAGSPHAQEQPGYAQTPASSGPPPSRVAVPGTPAPAQGPGISLGSLRDLESRLTGRLLAWVGGAAVVLGAIFFLSLAFSRGWIGPEGRVAMGLAGGAIFMGLGAWLFGRRQAQLGHVLIAVGLGIVSLALFAGTRLYGLFPPEVALAGSFAAAVVAAAIAVRVNSETVAIFGLVAVAAAPPVLGAPANLTTVAFLGVTLVGTTAIALARSWRWLPPTAFAITAPQLLAWIVAGPDAATAVAVLGGYWFLNALAASADELRAPQKEAEARAGALFLANSLLAVGAGLYVLSSGLAVWQGAYVTAAALAHFAFGAYFVWRRGDTYPFGMLVNAIGIAAVALAIERQFDGPAVAIGWAIEAVVLAAIYGFRRHVYAGGAAVLLAGLAVLHLSLYEYPALEWSFRGAAGSGPFPFADAAGLTLTCLLIAGFLGGWLSRSQSVRYALTTACLVVVAFSLPFELSGGALVVGWAAEAVALVAIGGFRRHAYLGVAAVSLALLPVLHMCSYEYPGLSWSLQGASGTGPFPFADSAGLTLGCLLVAAFLGGWLSRSHDARCGLTTAGLLAVAYSLPFELSGIALLAGWAILVPASVAAEGLLDRLPGVPESRSRLRSRPVLAMNEADWPDAPMLATATATFLAVAHFFAYDLPLDRTDAIVLPAMPFADLATASAAVGVAAFLLAALITARPDLRVGMILLAAALAAYTMVFELATPFAVVAWCALALGVGALYFVDRFGGWAYVAGAACLVAAAVAAILLQVVPVERLAVHASVASTGAWFALHSIVAICATSATLVIAARLLPLDKPVRIALVMAAATGLIYLLSALLVDFFQNRVGGSTAVEELQKQAQVGVSILWGVIGMAVFLAGIVGWRQIVREAGLALLALATAKVFLFDLSYLDVAYRVLSFMGLGLLLLAGAYAYQSLRPRRPRPGGDAPAE
jgi:hypothetical protein